MDTSQRQKKFYQNHRDKVLAYKKEYYYNKIKKYEPFKKLYIYGIKKNFSNLLIKKAIDNDKLLIFHNRDGLFDIKEFPNFFTILIPSYCLAEFINYDASEEIKIDNTFTLDMCNEYFNKGYDLLLNINSII
jgi:hypothetical protein